MKIWLILLPVLLAAGCQAYNSDPLAPVEAYLVENVGEANFGGRVFCTYDLLDIGVRFDGAEVYVWALCAEYFVEDGGLEMGTACSLPVALYMDVDEKRGFSINRHAIPGDGTNYGPDIRRIFTPTAIEAMCEGDTDCFNERAWRLETEVETQARAYYGLE